MVVVQPVFLTRDPQRQEGWGRAGGRGMEPLLWGWLSMVATVVLAVAGGMQ